jgi:hypothetical protein
VKLQAPILSPTTHVRARVRHGVFDDGGTPPAGARAREDRAPPLRPIRRYERPSLCCASTFSSIWPRPTVPCWSAQCRERSIVPGPFYRHVNDGAHVPFLFGIQDKGRALALREKRRPCASSDVCSVATEEDVTMATRARSAFNATFRRSAYPLPLQRQPRLIPPSQPWLPTGHYKLHDARACAREAMDTRLFPKEQP